MITTTEKADSGAEAETRDEGTLDCNMRFWEQVSEVGQPPTIQAIYMAPGHLIRRCHQISSSIFADELGEYGLTQVQYAALLAIRDHEGIDQRGLGNVIAFDRSTIATMLKGMEGRDLIRRVTPPENLRVKRLYITKTGNSLLTQTVEKISLVQQRLLAPLSPEEQDVFMVLLTKLVHVNNEFSRVPLKLPS